MCVHPTGTPGLRHLPHSQVLPSPTFGTSFMAHTQLGRRGSEERVRLLLDLGSVNRILVRATDGGPLPICRHAPKAGFCLGSLAS